MKIAIFTDLYLEVAGGIPSSVRAQKVELERLGHTVTVFCPGWECTEDGVELLPTSRLLKPGGAPLARWPGVVLKWLEKNHPDFGQEFDVVHVHYEAGASIAGVLFARKHGVPVVQTMHGREDMAIAVNVPHPFKTLAAVILCFIHGRYLKHEVKVRKDDYLAPTVARAKMWTLMVAQANAADRVVMPSKHFMKKFKHYGVTQEMTWVSNGVSDKVVNSRWPIRKVEPGYRLQMVWTSRLSKEKRVIPFLEALTMLKGEWELELYGNGNELGDVRRLVRERKLGDRVHIHGAVSHERLMGVLREAHLAILASYGFDNQAMTLLEAEAVGLPVFFCDPDMAEVVPKTGSIMAKGPSPEEMAEALSRVVAEPKLIEKMSRVMLEQRKEVAQSAQVKKLLKVYAQAIGGV